MRCLIFKLFASLFVGGFETMQDSQSEAESEDYFDAGPFSHQVESTCPTEIEFRKFLFTYVQLVLA